MSVVPSTVTSMYDLAVDLLGAVSAAMATTDAGPPDIAYITLGEPAWAEACGQAVVQAAGLTEGRTDPGSGGEAEGRRFERGRVNLVGMVAYAMRCVTISELNAQVFSLPSPATLSAIGKQSYEDGWAIWNYVTRATRKGLLFSGACSIVHFDGAPAATPEGNLGGWRFVCRVALDGYDPLPGS